MAVKLAINGFGRIGRCVLRALYESGRDDIDVVAINDLGPIETNAHLLRYDSVHGRFPGTVNVNPQGLDLGRGTIRTTALRNPAELPWNGVDVALECTGLFTQAQKAKAHLENGSRRVLISAPAEGADRTVVFGVNHQDLQDNDLIVSNASCTTNCLAPVAKLLHEAFGIQRGYMTTIHSYTGDQPVLDRMHKDLYRARAACSSMIPTSTGAARAVGLVIPDLNGKLDGSAIRVPTPNVSVVDLKVVLDKATNVAAVNDLMQTAAQTSMKGVLGYSNSPCVSIDFNHDPHSSIFAAPQTKLIDGQLLRVMSWYDNEWGFSNRMLDVAARMGASR